MRWLLAAAVVLILAGLAGSAAAQRKGEPSAQELWEQYPMEQAPPRPPSAPDDQPAPSPRPKKERAAKTPIRHFISLMQENHSFDNYFGTYPGADGIPKGTCMPVDPTDRGGECVKPFHIGNGAREDINQSARVFRAQYRRGRMDGFLSAIARERGAVQQLVMGHYDDRDIPFYWNVADDYVLFDRFFAATRGGSAANRSYWVSGRSGNAAPTIFDRLERAGVSWKLYVQDYDPHDPNRLAHAVPIDDLYEDLRRGTLPSVSYVVPARRSSEHPPESVTAGETLVRSLVSTLMRSRYWRSSAFMWTYDDWGGWYDHVKPPRVDRYGYGFRVPALLVSAFARKGHIENATMDSTSMLKFIEDNWGVEPLARRDRDATSIARAFDFSRGPREAVFLTRDRRDTSLPEPKRAAVYAAYSVALGLALAVIALALALDRRTPAVAALAALLLVAWDPAPARAAPRLQEVQLETVPPIAGVEIVQAGRSYRTDRHGRVTMLVTRRALDTPRVIPKQLEPGVTARLSRFYGTRSRSLRAGLSIFHRVRPVFADGRGAPVDPRRVRRFVFKSSIGVRTAGSGAESVELQSSRASLVGRRGVLRSRPIGYSVESVDVDGSNAVQRGRVRFFPSRRQVVPIKLLFYDVTIAARDALFGVSRGSSVDVRYPDGHVERRPLDDRGRVRLAALARGDYQIRVDAAGLGTARVMVLSRDQRIELAVLSYLDLGVIGGVLAMIAAALLLARRPTLRARLGWILARPFAGSLLALVLAVSLAAPAAGAVDARQPVGLWAYYYIWFNVSSWDRAKMDYPKLGRYSSDEPSIMRQHIRLAKEAGIDGFLVGWKSTPTLDTRLRDLIRVAEQERFRLGVVYQALDFKRRPLPIERVTFDLARFRDHFAGSPVFNGFGKPVVIWAGTWEFSRSQLERVAAVHRDALRLLASERNPKGYLARGAPFEGNAYYWSSVNPATYPRYLPKLKTMGRMVHEHDGLWIAPAAPGFDARTLGRTTVVRRDGGKTLRRQLDTAQRSEPDAIGLISWNEFSENTHVEPSHKYGTRALEVIADVEGTDFEVKTDLDSSAVPRESGQNISGLAATVGFVVVGLGALVVLGRRRRSGARTPDLSGG